VEQSLHVEVCELCVFHFLLKLTKVTNQLCNLTIAVIRLDGGALCRQVAHHTWKQSPECHFMHRCTIESQMQETSDVTLFLRLQSKFHSRCHDIV